MKLSFFVTFTSSLAVSLALACGGVTDLGGTSYGLSPATTADSSTAPGIDSSVGAVPGAGGGPGVPFDPDLMAHAAAFIGSCIPDDGSNSYLRRIYDTNSDDSFERLIQASGACFASKTNGCAAVTECLGITVARVGICTRTCDGDTVVGCDRPYEFRDDCTKRGEVCRLVDGTPECVVPGAQACDYKTYATSCAGGRPSYCRGQAKIGALCGDLGLACVPRAEAWGPGTETMHLCAGTGPTCKGRTYDPGSVEYEGLGCNDGSTLRACVNMFESTLSCPNVGKGFTCQGSGGKSFCGLAAECTPGVTQATCKGTSLVMCNAGKTTKIDCTTLGFTGCAPNVSVSGAVCTPAP